MVVGPKKVVTGVGDITVDGVPKKVVVATGAVGIICVDETTVVLGPKNVVTGVGETNVGAGITGLKVTVGVTGLKVVTGAGGPMKNVVVGTGKVDTGVCHITGAGMAPPTPNIWAEALVPISKSNATALTKDRMLFILVACPGHDRRDVFPEPRRKNISPP